MKKRIMAFFLVVMLLAGISVIGASAASSYNIWVGGVRITSKNAHDVLGDGKVCFYPENNVLYLNDAEIKGAVLSPDFLSAGVYASDMNLTVMLKGNNKITDVGGCDWSIGMGVENGNLIIKQDSSGATLDVSSAYAEGYSVGLYSIVNSQGSADDGDLLVEGGKVSVGYSGNKLSAAHGMGVLAFDVDVKNNEAFSITGAPSAKGRSFGINACGDINVSGEKTELTAKGSDGEESHGIYSIAQSSVNEAGEKVVVKEGNLTVGDGARVFAQGGEALLYSAGINIEGGVVCEDDAGTLTAIGSDTTYDIAKDTTGTFSRSYGISTYGNLFFDGGVVNAASGYGYDSCGINALSEIEYENETQKQIPLNGDVNVSGASVTAQSNGGYMYSNGMYVSGDLNVSSGVLTASGAVADAPSKDIISESNGIYANYNVNISGGSVVLSCKAVSNGKNASCAIFAYDPIVISEELEVKGAKNSFVAGDTQIVPENFDVPVIITKSAQKLLGDVNFDSDINIKDATAIQKHLALLELLEGQALEVADFNKDTDVTIKDATAIQKHIAGLEY